MCVKLFKLMEKQIVDIENKIIFVRLYIKWMFL